MSKQVGNETLLGMKVTEVSFTRTHRSVFGSYQSSDVFDILREYQQGIESQTILLQQNKEVISAPDLRYSVSFCSGSLGGKTYFLIKTTNIPTGAEVAFAADSQIPVINLPKTTITQSPQFSAGVFVEIPANFQTDIVVYLYLNGHALGDNAELELSAYLQIDSGASASDDPLSYTDPHKSKLLGAVKFKSK